MLTLLVFAATSTVICFVDGKDWYYHRLPATIATVLALLLWIATELRQRRPARCAVCRWSGAVLTLGAFCFNSVNCMQPEVVAGRRAAHRQRCTGWRGSSRLSTRGRYIAFSEWIALGFPVVNETGVIWASRFDSMWALKGEIWRAALRPDGEQGVADGAMGGA